MTAALAVLSGACGASAPRSVGEGTSVDRQTLELPGGALVTLDTRQPRNIESLAISAPAGRAFEAVRAAYDSLGIPVGAIDSRTLTLGNNGYRMRNSIAGVRMSRYFDCGGGANTAPNAERYTVHIIIASQIKSAGKDAEVRTALDATARPEGMTVSSVRCASTARLERQIAAIANAIASR